MNSIEQVQTRYRRFAEQECRGYCELYDLLAVAVADDDGLAAFIAGMPETQPNLFLAAIQSLTGPDDLPQSAVELRTFVARRRAEIAQLMQARRTQTNEVGRCATLLPALPAGPLALLEVGASAGLCLLLDRFHYDYGRFQLGDPGSDVRLSCGVNEACPLPAKLPEIGWRGGLDLAPLDVHNPGDVRWLAACIWPGQVERRQRLAAAVRIAQQHTPHVRRGNLVTDLLPLLAEIPQDLQLVIFHSAVLAYVRSPDRLLFARMLVEASRQRPIVWISNEGRSVVPEIAALAPPPEPDARVTPAPFLLGRTTFYNGTRNDECLGITQPHGATLKWLPSPAI